MSNKLTEKEQELLEKIEEGGIEMIKKHRVIMSKLQHILRRYIQISDDKK